VKAQNRTTEGRRRSNGGMENSGRWFASWSWIAIQRKVGSRSASKWKFGSRVKSQIWSRINNVYPQHCYDPWHPPRSYMAHPQTIPQVTKNTKTYHVWSRKKVASTVLWEGAPSHCENSEIETEHQCSMASRGGGGGRGGGRGSFRDPTKNGLLPSMRIPPPAWGLLLIHTDKYIHFLAKS
jgi:hypothetical protein